MKYRIVWSPGHSGFVHHDLEQAQRRAFALNSSYPGSVHWVEDEDGNRYEAKDDERG